MFTKNVFNKLRDGRFKHSWKVPGGFPTKISVYNCVTRKKEPFIVRNKNAVTWYTCGPTVYDSPHIGHASSYVRLDIIQNILRDYFNLNIISVMNITDIDDKIIQRAQRDNLEPKEVAATYETEFWEALDLLKIKRPDVVMKVTDHIDLIIDFIKTLVDSDMAYAGDNGSVYFDLSRSGTVYGKLQNLPQNDPDRETDKFKRSPSDFALWKNSKSGEPFWHSPWGPGRPGWHVECSTLASHALGDEIDVHAGGIDLRFPHHENEEVQSCAYFEKSQWVNYWLHTGHLHLKNSTKMSKSLKNTISINDVLKSCSPDVFRLACASSHYASNIEYSTDWVKNASNLFKVYKNFVNSCRDVEKGLLKPALNGDVLCQLLNESVKSVEDSFCDDFNTPRVVEVLNEICSVGNAMIYATGTSASPKNLFYLTALRNIVCNGLNSFGVQLSDSKSDGRGGCEDELIDILVNFRQNVRQLGIAEKNKQILQICDSARHDLAKIGVNLRDYGKQTSWSR